MASRLLTCFPAMAPKLPRLDRLPRGAVALIVRIDRGDPALVAHLTTLGILPGTRLEIEEIGAFGGPCLVRVGTVRYALGRDVASSIVVQEA
jgi:Fe2+ transport system protein FeoA